MRPMSVVPIEDTRVGAVAVDAKEFEFDERIKNGLTRGSVDAAEALDLPGGQAHPGHLHELRSQSFHRAAHCTLAARRSISPPC